MVADLMRVLSEIHSMLPARVRIVLRERDAGGRSQLDDPESPAASKTSLA
jgi:hypothetical protein